MKKIKGFTIIELLVAMVIGIILVGFVISIFINNKQAYNNNNRFIEMNDNIRFAITLISDDLINAGFFGGLTFRDPIYQNSVSNTACEDTGPQSTYNKNYKIAGGASVPENVVGSTATEFPLWGKQAAVTDEFGCLEGDPPNDNTPVTVGTDILSVKGVVGGTTPDGSAQPGSVYIRTGNSYGKFFTEDASEPTIPGSDNMNWQFNNHIYFISNNRLVRQTLGATGWAREILIGTGGADDAGIENMQILYGLDTSGDGIANYFTDGSSIGTTATTLSDWNDVVAVKLFVLARSAIDRQYTDTKTYQLGNVTVAAQNDNFHRKVFSSTIFLRNQWYVITGGI